MAAADSPAGSLRVLLVSDDPGLEDAVRAGFEAAAPDVALAVSSGGTDPVERVDDGIDAVVCSDGSTVDAVDTVRRLRAAHEDDHGSLPVVLLLGGEAAGDDAVADAVEAGVTDYFPRVAAPEQYELVAERLCDLVSRERAERTYEEIFETVSDGLVVHDPETGEILAVNERYCEMNGYSRDELIGEDVGVVTAPGDEYSYERARELIRRAREEGPQLFEWRNRHKDGETFPVEVSLSVVRIHGRERVLASVRDVTDRERREEELRETEERFRVITEHADQVIFITKGVLSVPEAYDDAPGGREVEYLSPAFERVFGLPVEAVYEDPAAYQEPIHPDDREGFRAMLRQVAADEERGEVRDSYESEFRVRHPEDGTRWVRVTVYPTPTHDADVYRLVGIMEDVTEHRRRERELEEERQRYSTLVEQSDDGVVVVQDGVYTFVNRRFAEMTGYDEADLLGMPFYEVIAPEYQGLVRERYEKRVRGEEPPSRYDVEVETAAGDRIEIELTVSRIRHGGEPATLANFRDVTERRRRESAIRNLHGATERIQDAETPEAVAETAIEAARDVLDLPMTACWLDRDGDAERLDPVAMTEPVRELDPAPFGPGDVEHEAFVSGETLVYDPSEHFPDNPLDAAIMLPLGDHGLLAAGKRGAEEYEEFVVDAGRTLAGHVTTALDRVDRAEELRRSERRFRLIAERVDRIVYLADATLSAVLYVNPAYEETFGRPVEELYDDARAFTAAVHPDDEDDYLADLDAMLADIDAGDPRDSYGFEFRIRRPDGEVRWIDATGYPILDEAGEPYRFVGIANDVTEEKRRERTLETFHEATRDLTEAGSRREASEAAVDAAEGILGFPLVSVHLHDETEGELVPFAATRAVEERYDPLPSFAPGDNLPWRAFAEGEAVRGSEVERAVDVYGVDGPAPELVLPLGPHGVMLVGATEPLDAERIELAQILGATVEAALNHIEGERELERREEELEEQQERAERLDRLNTLIRDIEQAIVETPTRAEIERAVCDRLIDVDPYRAAWIGDADRRDGTIAIHASAGDAGHLDRLDLPSGPSGAVDAHPAVDALETGAVAVERQLTRGTRHDGWRKRALRRGHQAVIAVPLAHGDGETTHGVLTIAADDPTAFDGEEREVLAELGRSIGYEITVVERRHALESDSTIELEFGVEDDGLRFVELSERGSCRVDLERTIRRSDGSFSTFYTVEGTSPTGLVEAIERSGTAAELISRDDEDEIGLIEVTADDWFGTLFTERGGVIRTALATDGEGRLAVEVPGGVDVRDVTEAFEERYPETELLVKRERERTVRTPLELQDALEEALTPRQLETLETAFSAGYFEWPRDSSGEDIAELLGITQPTFNKHLRAAERKAFTMLLDRRYPE